MNPSRLSLLVSAAVCLPLVLLPDASTLGETTAWLMAASIGMAVTSLLLAGRGSGTDPAPSLPIVTRWILLIGGAVLAAVFWHRAWTALPSVLGARPLLIFAQTIAFWWPGLLFAALYRHAGEGLAPASRRSCLARMGWGALGAAAGTLAQLTWHGLHPGTFAAVAGGDSG